MPVPYDLITYNPGTMESLWFEELRALGNALADTLNPKSFSPNPESKTLHPKS